MTTAMAPTRYTTTDITREFVEADPTMWRYQFDSDEAYNKYRRYAEPMIARMALRFAHWLDATDQARQAHYVADRKRLGNRTAPKGYKWGAVNESIACGGGIRLVSCAGHGGFLISQARQNGIPVKLQDIEAAYEEDCDFYTIGAIYPEAAMKAHPKFFTNAYMTRLYCADKVAQYHYRELATIVESEVIEGV